MYYFQLSSNYNTSSGFSLGLDDIVWLIFLNVLTKGGGVSYTTQQQKSDCRVQHVRVMLFLKVILSKSTQAKPWKNLVI